MEFICPHCKEKTEDTIGGILVDGFILECSECGGTTVVTFVVTFEAAQQSEQVDKVKYPQGISPLRNLHKHNDKW